MTGDVFTIEARLTKDLFHKVRRFVKKSQIAQNCLLYAPFGEGEFKEKAF